MRTTSTTSSVARKKIKYRLNPRIFFQRRSCSRDFGDIHRMLLLGSAWIWSRVSAAASLKRRATAKLFFARYAKMHWESSVLPVGRGYGDSRHAFLSFTQFLRPFVRLFSPPLRRYFNSSTRVQSVQEELIHSLARGVLSRLIHQILDKFVGGRKPPGGNLLVDESLR